MTHFHKAILSLACLILMAGCDQPSSSTVAKAKSAQDPIAADVDRMEADIRIAAANKRIDELERQVGALQATPEKLDLDLLTRRVETLEAKNTGVVSSETTAGKSPSGGPASDRGQTPRSVSKASRTGQAKPDPTSKPGASGTETRTRGTTVDPR
jgi:uncharacterized coiled-coil protein SlyX